MPERFFAGNTPRVNPTAEHSSLLSGPPACGKTSLLFQFAVNCAADNTRTVVFICNKKRLDHKPPFLSQEICLLEFFFFLKILGQFFLLFFLIIPHLAFQGMDPASEILGRIKMKYADDYDDIKKYFAAFHLLESFPAAVIIDDFGDFFTKVKYEDKYGPRDRNFSMVHALGLCSNAIAHANKKLQPSDSCKLLLSETHKRDSTSLFIYKRWIDSIFTIEDARGDGAGSFFLKRKPNPYSRPTRIRTAKYSVACPFLTLEEIANE